MVSVKDDDNIPTANAMVRGGHIYACARLDIPVFNRRTLRESAQVLHEIANALTRYSLNPPGETLSDATALSMASRQIRAANAMLLDLKKRDIAEHKRANVVKFGVERKAG